MAGSDAASDDEAAPEDGEGSEWPAPLEFSVGDQVLAEQGGLIYEAKDTAKSLIEDDTYYAMSLLTKGAFHSYVPPDVICCVRHSSLMTDSSTSSVRVFSCGHATHVHCELGNGALGQEFNAGCPLCTPKKNKLRDEKVLQDGLIESHVSRDWSANTRSVLHNVHEFDMGEKPYGLHQMSHVGYLHFAVFEILNNLGQAERTLQTETILSLRLAPPARESSDINGKPEPPSRMKTARDLRTKEWHFAS